ncbi:hypothetical protein [Terribacillus sp. DMT04]|uniref:hypothetical protein n=1 Tax=Terribacillus sp. DMT04 TaxID=2850441 RepID=UPI001C2C7D4B|nr:hypothetical protein [Terribacillus sp. DMT04]QXE02971.1 hypothetical protein KS242_07320 [Terribacillus sp. DMT04]
MRDVVEALRRREAEEKVPAIRLEIDYQLVTLHDAMQEEDRAVIEETKARLFMLRERLNQFER